LRWSRDNAGIAVAGEDRVIKLYKVKAPTDFVSPFEQVCKLEGGHSEPINCIDISPSKTLLISSGNDSQASVFDLRKRSLLQKLTFKDKAYRDARGNPDESNFMIRGCFFSPCGRYVYLLASRVRYRTFLVQYVLTPYKDRVDFNPISVLDVHEHASTGM
jgi:WD40 repeat protein